MENKEFWAYFIIGAVFIVLGFLVGYNSGRADGIEQGWQGCIEENNLYERYNND